MFELERDKKNDRKYSDANWMHFDGISFTWRSRREREKSSTTEVKGI